MPRISLIIGLFLSLHLSGAPRKMSLQQAMDRKMVETKVLGLGGYQGYCITITFINKTKDSLVVFLEAGRRLNSLEDKTQDILVVKEEVIALKKLETKNITVRGYCCQASNLCPAKGSRYGINKMADSNLLILARYLNTHTFEKNAEQAAIWSLSDNRSSATISSENDSLVLPLREMVAILKREELPWYTFVSKTYLYPSGVISVVPLFLKGTLTYSNEHEDYATLLVKNEKGMLVSELKSHWVKVCSNEDYHLNIPVSGLPKGKYSIELKTPGKQLASREFEI